MPRDYDVMWAFSTKKQSNYGTEIIDGDLTLAYPFKGPDILERPPEIITDEDQVGAGHEFLTRQDTERWDAKLKRNFDLTSMMAAWVAVFGLGKVVSALVSTSLAYQHDIEFSDPATVGNQNPVTTIVELLHSGIKRKISDLAISDFTISGDGKNRLQLEANLVGSGSKAVSSLTMPSLTVGDFLRMSGGGITDPIGVKFKIGVAAAEVDVSSRLRSFSLKIDNDLQLDDGYYPGTGLYRGRCLYGVRKPEFSFTLDAKAGEKVEHDHLESGQELKAILTVVGSIIEETYYHQLKITIPKLKYRDIKVGIEDGKQVYTIDSNLFYDSGSNGPLTIQVINTQASYLA